MKTTTVTVLLNVNPMAVARGYVDGDFLEVVTILTVRVGDRGFVPNDLCDSVFTIFNAQDAHDSGIQLQTHKGRSMSTGDVIEVHFEGKTYLYACADGRWDWINHLDAV